MDRVSLLKKSHEEYWLEAGFNLLLQFREGWAAFRIQGREPANLKPYRLGDVNATSNLSAWNEIKDSESRRYLEPYGEGYIYHEFWGVNKPKLRVYWQYPPRDDIGSVLTVNREITGDVGYVDGDESPYGGPYSPKTEIIAVHERYPAFQAYNPLSDAITNALMSFDYMKYTYEILKDQALIRDLLLGNRPARKYTMGRIDPNPMTIPDWLKDLVGKELLDFTKGVMTKPTVETRRGAPRTDIERIMAHYSIPETEAIGWLETHTPEALLPARGAGPGRAGGR